MPKKGRPVFRDVSCGISAMMFQKCNILDRSVPELFRSLNRKTSYPAKYIPTTPKGIPPYLELLLNLADYFGVTTDFLAGRVERNTLDATGLTQEQMTHIQLLIDDLRGNNLRNLHKDL